MIEAMRLGVVITPSVRMVSWRKAIMTRCAGRGWLIEKQAGPRPSSGSSVLFVKDALEARVEDADIWIVINGGSEAMMASALGRTGESIQTAQRFVASRLAAISDLKSGGAIVVDGRADQLDLPVLGTLSIDGSASQDAGRPLPEVLRIYEALPPASDAAAEWPWDTFDFTSGQEPTGGAKEFSLTGRARIVVHGPYIDLPAGDWKISASFTAYPEDIAYLRFQWGWGEDVSQYDVELAETGEYRVEMEHHWPHRRPAELRIWTLRAHFLGRMEMGDCRIERSGAA